MFSDATAVASRRPRRCPHPDATALPPFDGLDNHIGVIDVSLREEPAIAAYAGPRGKREGKRLTAARWRGIL
jgi:hypothetical protein